MFTKASKEYGLSDSETFQTCDLWDGENVHQVCICIQALGRKAQKNGLKGKYLRDVYLLLKNIKNNLLLKRNRNRAKGI